MKQSDKSEEMGTRDRLNRREDWVGEGNEWGMRGRKERGPAGDKCG